MSGPYTLNTNAKNNDSSQGLRQQAQEIVAETTLASLEALLPAASSEFVSDDTKRMVHELQMRQFELESQNLGAKLLVSTSENLPSQEMQQESLDRMRKLTSRLPGVVFQFRLRQDGTSCMPYASDGLQSLFRVRPEEVMDDASFVFKCIHPDDLDGLVSTIRISSEDLTPFQCDFRLLFEDGTLRWVLC